MKHNFKSMLAVLSALMMLSGGIRVSAADTAQNKPHETNDPIGTVASVSKVYVTAAVMQLVDRGKVDLDAPVTDYLPEFHMADPRYRDITVRMLMNHSSGLMGSFYSNDTLYDDRTAEQHDEILRHLSTERLKADPGAYSAYCNDGFFLLELIVEAVSGEDFTDYLEAHICKPLGLQQTGTMWNAFRTDEQIRMFGKIGSETFSMSRCEFPGEYCMSIGTGGVLATAPELCRFGTAFFTGSTELISDRAKKEMTTCYAAGKYEDGFGLGWDTVQEKDYQAAGVQVVSKGGDLEHQHAELLVAPDEKISISVITSGGSSSAAKRMAKTLMDTALNEQGITVEKTEVPQIETVDTVPEKYLRYEGIYADNGALYKLTFPEKKFMRIETLTSRIKVRSDYCYTTNDCFVKMYGKVDSGHAVQDSELMLLEFCEQGGQIYIGAELYEEDGTRGRAYNAGYFMQKMEEGTVSDEIQQAWNARNRKKYYTVGDRYSSYTYYVNPCVEIMMSDEAPGYAFCGIGCVRFSSQNAGKAVLTIPGSMSRDLCDVELTEENGTEYLNLKDIGMYLIAEDAIPVLTQDIKEVKLTTGAAAWYNIDNAEGRSLTVDLPEHAVIYVYDSHDKVLFSTLIKESGNHIPLPKKGKIVFLGETGSAVRIN